VLNLKQNILMLVGKVIVPMIKPLRITPVSQIGQDASSSLQKDLDNFAYFGITAIVYLI